MYSSLPPSQFLGIVIFELSSTYSSVISLIVSILTDDFGSNRETFTQYIHMNR